MAESLENIVREGSDIVKREFGLELSNSPIIHYSDDEWKEFCDLNKFDPSSDGIYVPGAKAYVKDSPHYASTVFHELYGHALFCEHSIPGKVLVEKQKEGVAKDFLCAESTTPLTITGTNLTDYEGFAMWMESTLCKDTGREDMWNRKKEGLHPQYQELWKYFMSVEEKLTRYGLMAQMGFPKRYEPEKLLGAVKSMYGENFDNIEMILTYGSKRPYSDIDLLIVSKNGNMNYFNGWLDIYELNVQTFRTFLDNIDISVTDPVMTGELIYGDIQILEDIKKEIITSAITPEKIEYNRMMASANLDRANRSSDNRTRKLGESYHKSYNFNAQALSEGRKLLTLKNLESVYGQFKQH